MKKMYYLFILIVLLSLIACQNSVDKNTKDNSNNSFEIIDSNTTTPIVLIYNFFGTHRCPSCVAIEKATIQALDSLYAEQVKNGTIKRFSINIDEAENAKLCEKYQAFGSGIFITRIFKGEEKTTDLTGDGFKFAKNKKDKFIEILKSKIDEFLKE